MTSGIFHGYTTTNSCMTILHHAIENTVARWEGWVWYSWIALIDGKVRRQRRRRRLVKDGFLFYSRLNRSVLDVISSPSKRAQIRELKMQTFSGRRRREERLRLGRDWLRMRPRRRPHVGDVRSVGLPSRWKRELILFVFVIYCQFCHLYSSDCIITFRINHPTTSRPTQETFCFLFSSKWPKQHVLQWSPNCRSKFWAFMVESTRLQQELEGPLCQTWILLCSQLHSCVISKSKRLYSSYGNWSQFDINISYTSKKSSSLIRLAS